MLSHLSPFAASMTQHQEAHHQAALESRENQDEMPWMWTAAHREAADFRLLATFSNTFWCGPRWEDIADAGWRGEGQPGRAGACIPQSGHPWLAEHQHGKGSRGGRWSYSNTHTAQQGACLWVSFTGSHVKQLRCIRCLLGSEHSQRVLLGQARMFRLCKNSYGSLQEYPEPCEHLMKQGTSMSLHAQGN